MKRFTQEKFLYYSRPLFRTCEIACNHAARIVAGKSKIANEKIRAEIVELNDRRKLLQKQLNDIGSGHISVCASCKGKCCGGVRERDAFIDRVLQVPETLHRLARRKTGVMPALEICGGPEKSTSYVDGHCPELTVEGCRVPYELRPIQCTAYFCRKLADEMTVDELSTGIKALAGLMQIQMKTVGLMLRAK